MGRMWIEFRRQVDQPTIEKIRVAFASRPDDFGAWSLVPSELSNGTAWVELTGDDEDALVRQFERGCGVAALTAGELAIGLRFGAPNERHPAYPPGLDPRTLS